MGHERNSKADLNPSHACPAVSLGQLVLAVLQGQPTSQNVPFLLWCPVFFADLLPPTPANFLALKAYWRDHTHSSAE